MNSEFNPQSISELHQRLGIASNYGQRHKLSIQPPAGDLVEVGPDCFGRPLQLSEFTATQWQAMDAAAQQDGIELLLVSGYRSIERQTEIIERKLAQGQTIDEILKVSAAPGYSEHHTGRALDLNTPGCEALSEAFDQTDAFRWLEENAARFQFFLSYPKDNRHNIAYEPWHWATPPTESSQG